MIIINTMKLYSVLASFNCSNSIIAITAIIEEFSNILQTNTATVISDLKQIASELKDIEFFIDYSKSTKGEN